MISKEPGEEAASASIAAFGASSAHCPVRLVVVAEQPVGLSVLICEARVPEGTSEGLPAPEWCFSCTLAGAEIQTVVAVPLHTAGPSTIASRRHRGGTCWLKVAVEDSRYQAQEQPWGLDGARRGAWQNGNRGRSQPPTPALAWGTVAAPTLLGPFLWEPAHPGYVIPALGSLLLPGLLCWEVHGHRLKGILVPWEAIPDKLS